MSTTIDRNVVEMQFDNSKFESNVKQSMSTLDKLKNALNFKNVSSGIEELNKATKSIDFSEVENAAYRSGFHIKDVWLKLSSVFEYQIANKIVNSTERIAKALSADQISAGWQKLADKTTAVQTIMSATSTTWEDNAKAMGFAGTQMEFVTDQLEKLNWFSDETSYSFTDMTSNIGKFTSAGVSLSSSVTAMEGIALWAAKAGQNSQAAARAMYNLSQALGTGSVKAIDWRSIENVNMSTVEFKQTALDTAEALGTLKKQSDGTFKTLAGHEVTVTNFTNALKDGWFNSNVLIKSLNEYGKAATLLSNVSQKFDITTTTFLNRLKDYQNGNLTLAEFAEETSIPLEALTPIVEKLTSEEYELSLAAFRAGQECKTFGEVVDATADAASSMWMNMFGEVFGNYEEQKELWSSLAETFYDTFVGPLENLRFALKDWNEMGGRADLFDEETGALWNFIDILNKIIKPLKEVMNWIFPPITAENIKKFTEGLRDFVEKLRPSEQTLKAFKDVLYALAIPLKIIVNIAGIILKALGPIIIFVSKIIGFLVRLGSIIVRFGAALAKTLLQSEEFTRILQASLKILIKVRDGLTNLTKKVRELFNKGISNRNISILDTFCNVLLKIGTISLDAIATVLEFIADLDFSHITDGVKRLFANLKEFASGNKFLTAIVNGLEKLWNIIIAFKDKVKLFFETLFDDLKNVNSVGEFFTALKDAFLTAAGIDTEGLSKKFEEFKTKMGEFFDGFKSILKNMPWAKLILATFAIAVAAFVLKLSAAISELAGLVSSIKNFVSNINTIIKGYINFNKTLKVIGSLILLIAVVTASIYTLSKLPVNKLKASATAIVLATLALAGIVETLTLLSAKNPFAAAAVKELGKTMLAFAASVAVLSIAMELLTTSTSTFGEHMLAIVELASILGVLVVASMLISAYVKEITVGATTMIGYAVAVGILALALKQLAEINFIDVEGLVDSMLGMCAGLALVTVAASKVKTGGLLKVIAIAIILKKLLPEISNLLNSININNSTVDLVKVLLPYVERITYIVATSILLSSLVPKAKKAVDKARKSFSGLLKGLMELAAAMLLISFAFKLMAENLKDPWSVIKSFGVFLSILTVLVLATFLAKKINFKATIEIQKGLAQLAGAVAILSLVTALIGQLDLKDLLKGLLVVGALTGIMGGIVKVAKGTKGINIKGIANVAGAVAALVGLVAVIALLSDYDPTFFQSILESTVMIGLLIMALAASMTFVNKASENAKMGPILSFMACLLALIGGLIAAALLLDDQQKMERFAAATAVMIVTMFSLAGSFAAISKTASNINWTTLLAMAVNVAAIGASLVLISALANDTKSIYAAGVAMALSLAALGAGLLIAGKNAAQLDWKSLLAMALNAAVVGASLVLLSKQDYDSVFVSAVSLSMCMLALAKAADIANASVQGASAMIKLAASMAIVSLSLLVLTAVPWEEVAAAAAILAVFTFALVGIAALAEKLDVTGASLLKLSAAMATISIQIVAIGVVIDILVIAFAALFSALTQFITVAMQALMNADQLCAGMIKFAVTTQQVILIVVEAIVQGIILIASAVGMGIIEIAASVRIGIVEIASGLAEGMVAFQTIIIQGLANIVSSILGFDWAFKGAAETNVQSYQEGYVEEFYSPKFLAQVKEGPDYVAETLVKSGSEPMEEAGKENANQFLGGFLNGSTDSQGATTIDAFKNNFTGALSGLGVDMESIGSFLGGDLANSFGTSAISGISSVIDKLTRKIRLRAVEGAETVDKSGNKVVMSVGKAADSVDKLGFSIEDLFPKVEDFTEGMDGAAGATSKAGGAAKEAKSEFEELGDAIKSGIEGSMSYFDMFEKKEARSKDDILASMRSQVQGLMSWTKDIVTLGQKGLSQGLLTKLAEDGMNSYDLVQGFLQMTTQELQEANLLYQQELLFPESAKNSIMNSWILSGKQFGQGFANGLDPKAANAMSELLALNALNTLKYTLDEHSPSRKTFKMGENFVQGLSNGIKTTNTAVNETSSMATRLLSELNKKLNFSEGMKVGKNFTDGLASGINSKEGKQKAIDAAKDLGNSLPYWVRKVLNINSPSKVAEEIGKYFDLGLAKGIDGNTITPIKASKSMAESAVDAMRSAVNKISSFAADNIEAQPKITPVLDLTDLRNGIGNMNSIMNTSLPLGNLGFNYLTNTEVQASNNSDVVEAINSLKDDVVGLKQSMSNIKIMLDSGTMVGAMINDIDTQLGVRAVYAGRGI